MHMGVEKLDIFSRLELFAGEAHLRRMAKRHATVLGIGGVGSYVVEALARGGIGHLTLVDPDCIAASNVNRQLYALPKEVGQAKVKVAARRCKDINPDMEINLIKKSYSEHTAEEILTLPTDFVFDCMDTVSAKIDLIERCTESDLPVISSMGSANKLDPGKIQTADLFSTTSCRLARIVRKELRRRGVKGQIPVVYSTEEFIPLKHAVPARRTGSDWEKVPLGTTSYVPPLFGLMMAGYVLQQWLQSDMPGLDAV